MLMLAPLHAQDSIFKLKGQVDAYAGLNFGNPLQLQQEQDLFLSFLLERVEE